MSEEHFEERIKEAHECEMTRFAGISSLVSIALPILSEFEGVGENVFMVIGGAGAVSVFSVLMKVARVTCEVQNIYSDQDEYHIEEKEKEIVKIKTERNRRSESKYLPDPSGWRVDEKKSDNKNLP